MRFNILPVLPIAVVAVLSAAALPTPGREQAAEAAVAHAVTIKIDNFAFSPAVITVQAGTQVTWVNNDDDAHSIVASAGGFHSTPLDTGDHYTFTFSKAGTYAYHCGLHPRMVGKVVVTP